MYRSDETGIVFLYPRNSAPLIIEALESRVLNDQTQAPQLPCDQAGGISFKLPKQAHLRTTPSMKLRPTRLAVRTHPIKHPYVSPELDVDPESWWS